MYQVFHYPQPNLKYVKKLRALAGSGDWPELRDKILAAGTLYNSSRERLLLEESLYDRLLALVIEQNDISAFERWAPELLPRFPEQFTEACVRCVDSIMRTSYSRNEYARTIANLKKLHAYPNRRTSSSPSAGRRRTLPVVQCSMNCARGGTKIVYVKPFSN